MSYLNLLIKNKHLTRLITEYIDFNLSYLNELIRMTKAVYNDLDDWRYYNDYCIKYDQNTRIYKIGWRDNHKFQIIKYDVWYIDKQ